MHIFWDHIIDIPGPAAWITRHPHLGHYCAYVQVPKGHPGYGKCSLDWWRSAHLDFSHAFVPEASFADFQIIAPGKCVFLLGIDFSMMSGEFWRTITPQDRIARYTRARAACTLEKVRKCVVGLESKVQRAYKVEVFQGQMA